MADIHVVREEDTYYDDEGYAETYTYSGIWIKRLYFPNGNSIEIHDQLEPVRVRESVFVKDAQGRSWYVKLLKKPASEDDDFYFRPLGPVPKRYLEQ